MPESSDPCSTCSGAKEVACGKCVSGQVSETKVVKDAKGNKMRVTVYNPCSHCTGGYVTCPGCGGTGRAR